MNVRTQWRPLLALAVTASLLLAACSSNTGSSASASTSGSSGPMDLNTVPPKPDYSGTIAADGATFPQPVYEQWTQDYANETGIQISYTGGGSGQGVKDITANVVQFAGSDAPLKPDEKTAAEAKGGPIFHIPTVFGAIVMAYNLPGLSKPLNFSAEVIGKIYTGAIKTWDDPAIKADNPDATLPSTAITVAHRSDGSGTTNAFTTWLCKVSPEWKAKVNPCSGKEVTWPVGLGGKGNAGVSSTITTNQGAIGYIELAYAMQNNVPFGNVQNSAGTFIMPSLDSVAAAAKFDTIPPDLTFDVSGSSQPDAYPIVTATWILVFQNQDKVSQDEKRSDAVVHFLIWALDKGGDSAKSLGYATLPDALKKAALEKIATISWNGTPIVNSLYK
ncbi:MAG: phosphate ABC transporter substrate-binding protein PstS [Chloroflexi bacterium]|nr:MAG: phosphate ABC transporter substrate-binding protein PstS [Chloroflexota bacterium]